MHDISKKYARAGEFARCKTCGLVLTEESFSRRRRFGLGLLIAAAVIAVLMTVAGSFSVLPSALAGFGGLVVTFLLVFGSAALDRDTVIGLHAHGR